ncbi:hypothetical protein FIBSPDRAFT_952773 [Athelia psychrophila]|uniref:Uncharacterized protein n=1 Tax=Athelia psychrophila TaxID=1759441 RepID=A0A166L7Z9_9AGAM|nr:hypothetical protein FIBSPDRAFT_952773 [Fibularhizoctonia sp. CBS 109695]
MARYDTSNTQDCEINNIARDQVSLSTRDVIIHHHYHFYSNSQRHCQLGRVAAADGSSSTGARDWASGETRDTVEESEATDRKGSGSLFVAASVLDEFPHVHPIHGTQYTTITSPLSYGKPPPTYRLSLSVYLLD